MKNKELIRKFKEGYTKGIAGHLYIKENELINYETVIAYRDTNRTISFKQEALHCFYK